MPLIVISISTIVAAMGGLISLVLKAMANNTNAINSNNETIQQIKIWMERTEMANSYEEKECNEKHCYVNKKIGEHTAKIEAHGIILAEHETKIKGILK